MDKNIELEAVQISIRLLSDGLHFAYINIHKVDPTHMFLLHGTTLVSLTAWVGEVYD